MSSPDRGLNPVTQTLTPNPHKSSAKKWRAPETRREATEEELRKGHFTRMTIRELHRQFWQDLQGSLLSQLADFYYFYLHGEPVQLMQNPDDVADTEFIPVDIQIDDTSLRDIKSYVYEMVTKASLKLTWEFSIQVRKITVNVCCRPKLEALCVCVVVFSVSVRVQVRTELSS